MIVKLYAYFGIVGIASMLAWLGALAMLINYAWHARRTFFYARALALALAGLALAQVNSFYVSRIEVDRRQDAREARQSMRRAQRSGADILNSKTAGLRFAEDNLDDSLDMAGIASADTRSIYEQAADENKPAAGKKPRKSRWSEHFSDEIPPGVKLLPERDVARANSLDILNLWMARFVPILAFLLLLLDYFLRFNRTVGSLLPLPFGGRVVDSIFPKKHSAVFRAEKSGLLPAQLATIIRKGETFIYFGDKRVVGTPTLHRLVLPWREIGRGLAALCRPHALLNWLARRQQGSGHGLTSGRLWHRIKDRSHTAGAVSVRGIKTLGRWIATLFRWTLLPGRWLARKAAAVSWLRKPAAGIGRLFRNAGLRLGQCGQRVLEHGRRWVRNIRSGTLEFWPEIILDATPDQAFNQDFIFECAWFNRYGFTVEGLNRSTALLAGFRKFIAERMVPRATAAKTLHVVWNFRTPINPDLLRPLAVLSREVNLKLIVFAPDAQLAEIGKWVEEVCPDETPPRAYPSLFTFVMLRLQGMAAPLQPWLARRRQERKARRERVNAERAARAEAAKAAAKPKAPAKAAVPEKQPVPAPVIMPPAPIPVAPAPEPLANAGAPLSPGRSAPAEPGVAAEMPAPIPKAPAPAVKPVEISMPSRPAVIPKPQPKTVVQPPAPMPAPLPKLKVPQVKAAQPTVVPVPKPQPKTVVQTPAPVSAPLPKPKVPQPQVKAAQPTAVPAPTPQPKTVIQTPAPAPTAIPKLQVPQVKAAQPTAVPAPTPQPKTVVQPQAPALAAIPKPQVPQPAPAPTALPKVKAAQPTAVPAPTPQPKTIVQPPAPVPAPLPKLKVPQPQVKAAQPTAVPAPMPQPKTVVQPSAPVPAPLPKLKVPQPAPAPTTLPKVKAAQPPVAVPPKPTPKVEAPQPKAKPAVIPMTRTSSVPGVADFKEIKLKPPEKPGHVILAPKIKMPPAVAPATAEPKPAKSSPTPPASATPEKQPGPVQKPVILEGMPRISEVRTPITQTPGASILKPEAEIKPPEPVIPPQAPNPVADVKIPVPVPTPAVMPAEKPMPAEPVFIPKPKTVMSRPKTVIQSPAPAAASRPKLKMPQPQPTPVPTALPKVKAAQPPVVTPPQPAPKVQAPQPKANPAVMPMAKTPLPPEPPQSDIIGPPAHSVVGAQPLIRQPTDNAAAPVPSAEESKSSEPTPPPAIPEKPSISEPKAPLPESPKTLIPMPPSSAPAEELKPPEPLPEAQASSSQIAEVNEAAGVFKFYCPSCQQKLSAQMAWQGKSIFCPACKTQITIPTL